MPGYWAQVDAAQLHSACLACIKLWVQLLQPPKSQEQTKSSLCLGTQVLALSCVAVAKQRTKSTKRRKGSCRLMVWGYSKYIVWGRYDDRSSRQLVTLCLLRKKREKDALLFIQSGTPDHGVVLPTFSLIFLSQISLETSSQTPLLPRTLAPRWL